VPSAKVNGVELAYQEAGEGFPLVWCHEFAGSMESWLPQVRFFARRYRVITYNARGYPPSEVPTDPAAYSQDIAVEDLYGLLRHLGIETAYIGGLSMGGATTLHFGIRHPEMARALVIAAAGSGSTSPEQFREGSRALANRLEAGGTAALHEYAQGATRVQLRRKDPVGFDEFRSQLMAHSALGSALTMRGVQAGRPPIFVWEKEMQALAAPALIMVGDEDSGCIEPSLSMKRNIPSSGLVVFPQSGHALNLEEPDMFNRHVLDFLTAVEAGKWAIRSPA
jgi:pimeloyl-ACP methyl ester carboxylesterase